MAVKVRSVKFQVYFRLVCVYYFYRSLLTTAVWRITNAVDEVYWSSNELFTR